MRFYFRGMGVLIGNFDAEPADSELTVFAENLKAFGWFDVTSALPPTFHG